MNYLLTFLLFLSIDFFLTLILNALGVPFFTIDIVVTFVLSFLFAYLRHDKRNGPFYKNMEFHRNFAIIFIVLLAFTYVIGYIL